MPYRNEYASGDSLWRLVESESVKEFEGIVRRGGPEEAAEPPRALTLARGLKPRYPDHRHRWFNRPPHGPQRLPPG